ncbi:hypothetical protein ACQEVF_47030 [Nonomuraea polychroma]|uniref:hypothetical protein n=1 Tax=Nonomuraea polychroma TaxID=46176 RepID=UPI003D8AA7D0
MGEAEEKLRDSSFKMEQLGADRQLVRAFRRYVEYTGQTLEDLREDWIPNLRSTPTTGALLQQDGTIVADRPDSPSLSTLRDWLTAWEDAGRPAPKTYTPTLASHDEPGMTGWNLRLTR